MPSYEPFMTHVDDDALRAEMWKALAFVGSVAPHDNAPLISRILALRAEKAAILGKKHFADLITGRRMTKSGKRALEFVDDVRQRFSAAFARECRELEESKAADTGAPVGRLAPWELLYRAERLRKARYAFDEEELRPYFPMERVMSGLFELTGRIFGIRVVGRAAGDVETWNPEVRFYDVFNQSGKHAGSFYTDWHPRESKRGGAWMSAMAMGALRPDGTRQPHLGTINGNLTPPGAGRPALLSHREVETIFHEFGHLLHQLLSEVELKSFGGTNVAWDFVELPSQIMENWCWERESLDLFARHYETGEPVPEPLFAKMTAAKNFRSAALTMRHMAIAKIDLIMHTEPQVFAGDVDIEAIVQARVADCLIPTVPPAPSIIRRIGHLFDNPVGYAAGFYSYKWAEVLDADAFTRFQREGIFSSKVGREFVEKILSRGNSEDPAKLFREFMGRDPDLAALLTRSGLAA
jgi:oligopeptidase A